MPASDSEIQNILEQKLADTLAGKAPVEFFMKYLMGAQVFMPVKDETGTTDKLQPSGRVQPLVVEDEEGDEVLILFTSQVLAREFVAELPDFKDGLLTQFSQVLRRLQGPINISLNPAHEIGLDLDAAEVAELIATLPPETA